MESWEDFRVDLFLSFLFCLSLFCLSSVALSGAAEGFGVLGGLRKTSVGCSGLCCCAQKNAGSVFSSSDIWSMG